MEEKLVVPKRFGVLRLIGTMFKILAWVILVLSIVGALVSGVSGVLVRQFLQNAAPFFELPIRGDAVGIFIGLGLLLIGIVNFLAFYAVGESIQLQISIEENTRMTAALLLRLDEASQQEAAYTSSYNTPTYYGEVVEE